MNNLIQLDIFSIIKILKKLLSLIKMPYNIKHSKSYDQLNNTLLIGLYVKKIKLMVFQ